MQANQETEKLTRMAKQHAPGFLNIVQDAKTRVRECTVHDVKKRQDRGDSFYLVDVREESEWAGGRVPSALHLGKGIIERDIEKAIPTLEAEIVLYCGGGYRSALAADNLQKMGYQNVLSMDGGFSGWKDAGFDVVR
jgi:rhodanese-related sulfurtransferase